MKSTTKIAVAYMISVILLAVAVGALIFISLKGCSEITDYGLKNAIEDVWEGNQSKGVTE